MNTTRTHQITVHAASRKFGRLGEIIATETLEQEDAWQAERRADQLATEHNLGARETSYSDGVVVRQRYQRGTTVIQLVDVEPAEKIHLDTTHTPEWHAAAVRGDVVTNAHARYCAAHGHATHHVAGELQPHCARCGDLAYSEAVYRPGAQHLLAWGTSETYVCGANAVGRRNTRTDMDRSLTSCPACLQAMREQDEFEYQNNL